MDYTWIWSEKPKKFEWKQGDIVYVPPYSIHQHFNSEPEGSARLLVTTSRVPKYLGFDWMEQVENAPDVDTEKPVHRQRQSKLPNDWPSYWGGGRLLIAGAFSTYHSKKAKREKSSVGEQEADPHLRSTREVIGYRIQASDGNLGHVSNFIVDDRTWAVCSMVVNTRNWLPGRKVILPTQWVEEIRWSEYKVLVDRHRETIIDMS